MPFQPVANCTRCELRWQGGTNLCENTFTYVWSGSPPNVTELTSLATEIAGTIGLRMRNLFHTSMVLREVYCRNIHAQVADQATYTFPANTTGNRTGFADALNVAAGLVKRTGRTGRSQRGRNSFSGFSEGDIDSNTITSFLMQVLADLAISILANRVGARFIPGVASPTTGQGTVLRSVLSVDNHVDSQKTRLNTHGT